MNVFKHGQTLILVTLFVLATLSGCVPTITKVYQAPKVTGQVLDLETLRPLVGVNVAHLQNTEKFVTTDAEGRFVLPSIAQTDLKILMAGHALKTNLVTFYNQDNQIELVAKSTLESRVEETINFGIVIFDSQPKKAATPVKLSYQSLGILKTYFSPSNILGRCDNQLAKSALASLNTSRKLAEAASSKIERTSSTANKLRSYTLTSYQRTSELWLALKASCERTTKNYKRIDAIFDSIQEESTVVVF